MFDFIKFRKFFELCSEDTPMIRRTVALKIGVNYN